MITLLIFPLEKWSHISAFMVKMMGWAAPSCHSCSTYRMVTHWCLGRSFKKCAYRMWKFTSQIVKPKPQKWVILRKRGSHQFLKEVEPTGLVDAEDTSSTSIYSVTKKAGFRTPTEARVPRIYLVWLLWAFPVRPGFFFYQRQIACQRHFYKNLPKYSISCVPNTLLHFVFNSRDT